MKNPLPICPTDDKTPDNDLLVNLDTTAVGSIAPTKFFKELFTRVPDEVNVPSRAFTNVLVTSSSPEMVRTPLKFLAMNLLIVPVDVTVPDEFLDIDLIIVPARDNVPPNALANSPDTERLP